MTESAINHPSQLRLGDEVGEAELAAAAAKFEAVIHVFGFGGVGILDDAQELVVFAGYVNVTIGGALKGAHFPVSRLADDGGLARFQVELVDLGLAAAFAVAGAVELAAIG